MRTDGPEFERLIGALAERLAPLVAAQLRAEVRREAGVSLAEAVRQLVAAKTVANCRPRYVASLEAYLGQFIRGRESTPINEISVDQVEAWFDGRDEAGTTRASNVGRLSALFSFGIRRGWIRENPTKRLERIRTEPKPPRVLSPAEAGRLLDVCRTRRPGFLGYVVLGLFAGIRPDELQRLDWSALDAGCNRLVVDAAASKVRMRRIVELHPTCSQWLRTIETRTGRISPACFTTFRRWRRDLANRSGIEWSQDLLRHTAASYLLALHGDAGKVAGMLGNSAKILGRHYIELVSSEACAEFWGLTPPLHRGTIEEP